MRVVVNVVFYALNTVHLRLQTADQLSEGRSLFSLGII